MGCNQRPGSTVWAAGPVLAAIVVFIAHPTPHENAEATTAAWHATGPPAGHTGGFGEPTCHACHSEFDVNPSPGRLGIDGVPTRYAPGQRYMISISILGDDTQSAGFQAAIRFLGGPNRGASGGRLDTLDDHVTVTRGAENGIDYVQHTQTGSRIVINGVATWTFVWNAPNDTTPVVLHVAANDANGDNSPLGDFVYASEVVVHGLVSEIERVEHARP